MSLITIVWHDFLCLHVFPEGPSKLLTLNCGFIISTNMFNVYFVCHLSKILNKVHENQCHCVLGPDPF